MSLPQPSGSSDGKTPRDRPADEVGARRARLALILGGLSAFGPLSIDMYLPSLPGLTRDLGTVPAEAQLTLTACLVGLAVGQFIAGPLSDSVGRRRPLLAGLAMYAAASLLCAAAPSVEVLIALRLVQGLAGGTGIVIARAMVRDVYEGDAVARFFSLLMLVMGLAPMLAPVAGAQLLRVTSWRGIFVVLAAVGVVLLVTAAVGLWETLPSERRDGGRLRATAHTFGRLLSDRVFVGYVVSFGLAFAAMFIYISGSPFVLEGIYHVSPQVFSLVFGSNALGIVLAGQLTGRLVGRVRPRRLLVAGLAMGAAGGAALLTVVALGIELPGVLPALFVVIASVGVTGPTATALSLVDYPPRIAGSASSLMGLGQSMFGAAAAPLVGVAGTGSALPMAALIAAASCAALLAFALLAARPSGRRIA